MLYQGFAEEIGYEEHDTYMSVFSGETEIGRYCQLEDDSYIVAAKKGHTSCEGMGKVHGFGSPDVKDYLEDLGFKVPFTAKSWAFFVCSEKQFESGEVKPYERPAQPIAPKPRAKSKSEDESQSAILIRLTELEKTMQALRGSVDHLTEMLESALSESD